MQIDYEKIELNHVESIDKLESSIKHRLISKKDLETDIISGTIYGIVAIYLEKIIAYGYIKLMVDHADLMAICVNKDFRNKKIGTNIINIFEKHLIKNNKEIEKILLEVRSSNIAAINFYEKLAYKKIATRRKYYDNSEDAFIYEKDLTN